MANTAIRKPQGTETNEDQRASWLASSKKALVEHAEAHRKLAKAEGVTLAADHVDHAAD